MQTVTHTSPGKGENCPDFATDTHNEIVLKWLKITINTLKAVICQCDLLPVCHTPSPEQPVEGPHAYCSVANLPVQKLPGPQC